MFKIVRFPSKLEPFFRSLTTFFHWEHFDYFRILVLLISISTGRRNISALYRNLDAKVQSHRTRFNNFLNLGRWDMAGALKQSADELLAALRPCKGEVIELVIDDSKKRKRGKRMDAVGWIFDPTTGRNIRGHQYVKATIRFRGYTIPFAIRLFVKKSDCKDVGVPFRKTTELAADLIRELQPPAGVSVRVLFDSYYLCKTVVNACRDKGFRFVSTLKANRNLFKDGRKLKAGDYGRNLFRKKSKRKHKISKFDGEVTYKYVAPGWMDVGDLGSLCVVYSRKGSEPGILGLVTDEKGMTPADIIDAYDDRWSIEVFFKDAKQLLGLGQYQNRSYTAAVTHLHLVCFAYALLTHLAVARDGEKGKRRKAKRASTGELQNELRRIAWEDLADYLKELPDGNSVVKELDRLFVAA